MIIPSTFFTGSAHLFGEPAVALARELASWKRPAMVSHPTIRRIDWRNAAEPWPGEAPMLPDDTNADLARYSSETFVWARSAWRGLLGPQLAAIVPWREASFDWHECHPFALGYVRGALWELVEHASPGESWSLPAFIAIAATADVFGLEWVDEIEDVIDDLKGRGLPPASTLAFQEGARRGIEDMECYLAGTDLESRQLVEWFESLGLEPIDARIARSSLLSANEALRGAMPPSVAPDATRNGASE